MFRIDCWGSTDVGRKRNHNEDSFLLAPDLDLFVVADGMGGHAGGEMASGLAVRTVEKSVRARSTVMKSTYREQPLEQNPVGHLLAEAVRAACASVYDKAQEVPELHGMGTTMTALLFHDVHAFVAHVGDSRCYLVRDGCTLQLSEDHSLVNEQIKAGLITQEQARTSRFKNVITRSVGFEDDVEVDVIAVEVRACDVYLVCCDGLSNLVTDEEIGEIVGRHFLPRIPEVLIALANSRGGDDNITVLVAAVTDASDICWDEDAQLFEAPPAR